MAKTKLAGKFIKELLLFVFSLVLIVFSAIAFANLKSAEGIILALSATGVIFTVIGRLRSQARVIGSQQLRKHACIVCHKEIISSVFVRQSVCGHCKSLPIHIVI
jgi:hypothetical protein